MRHLVAGRKLNRTSAHRKALLRNMAQSLFEHEQVRTTLPKAKELSRFAEKLITLAKKAHKGDLGSLQLLISRLCDRAIIASEHREAYESMSEAVRRKVLRSRSGRRHRSGQPRPGLSFTAESVVHRLVNTIAGRYADRPGGYTRVIKLAATRIGDNGAQAVVQLVGSEEDQGKARSSGTTGRRRRAAGRYEMAKRVARAAGASSQVETDRKESAEGEQQRDEPQARGDAATEGADEAKSDQEQSADK